MARRKGSHSSSRDVVALKKQLTIVPIVATLIKLIIILRLQPVAWPGVDPSLYRLDKFWLGADGENYITGLTGLFADGFFSQVERLTYFPAGYPILMFILTFWSQSWSLPIVAILQTILYCVASIYFVNKVVESRLSRFSLFVALILAINPTLALSSYAIGYESPVASFLLVVLGLLISDYKKQNSSVASREVILAAVLLSIVSFMQPRMIVTAIIVLTIWALATRRRTTAAMMIILSLAITLLLPLTLYARNLVARDVPAISTNLGTTIFIGVGPEATGGYNGKYNGVPCPEAVGTEVEVDNAKVRCAIEWYFSNPTKAMELAVKKAIFYWSPWFGPVANGTMARNPWSQNHPFKSTAQTPEGFELVFGTTGKVLSWVWLISTLIFLGVGFGITWRIGGLERLLGLVALLVILSNMAISMVTIGDHRFRLPAAGLSLFLQAIGLVWVFSKKRRRVSGPEEKLLWKSFQRTTNLPT